MFSLQINSLGCRFTGLTLLDFYAMFISEDISKVASCITEFSFYQLNNFNCKKHFKMLLDDREGISQSN